MHRTIDMISTEKVWGSGGTRYMEKMESLTVHPANLKVTKVPLHVPVTLRIVANTRSFRGCIPPNT